MTRRRLAIAAALALLAGGGWWLLLAPAAPRPVVPPPVADADVDIDPPGLRSRRQAALALATAPDDPWSLAESLAASAAASAAPPAPEDCGLSDAPQFADTDGGSPPPMTRAAAPRYLAAQSHIDAALRASADPLDRAAADFVNAGDMRATGGGDESVVAQAAGSSDPRLVAIGYAICRKVVAPGCGALTAERWAQADAGNGMPWVDLLARAQASGDAAGVQEAMSRLAAATRFDTQFFAMAGAVVRHLPPGNADLGAANELVTRAVGRASSLSFPSFRPLIETCRGQAGGDEQRAAQCRTIADTMYTRSDTLLTYLMSGALLYQTTGDPTRRETIKAELQLSAAHWSPATGLSVCGTARDAMRRVERNAQVGEVEAMREELRKFVTP